MRKLKKELALFIVCVLVFSLLFTIPSAADSGGVYPCWNGSGEEGDPYLIEDVDDWEAFVVSVNGKKVSAGTFFRLENNINAENSDSIISYSFRGNFNGNGYTLTIGSENHKAYMGAFSLVHRSGKIENLTVEGVISASDYSVGGIAGENNGLIINCTNKAIINGNAEVGGITGINSGKIINCINNGVITNGRATGGIAGENLGSEDEDVSEDGLIMQCYNTGTVSNLNAKGVAGGITGKNLYNAYIKDSYNAGTVDGAFTAGGIAGQNGSDDCKAYIERCYNIGNINNQGDYVNSIVGKNVEGVVTGCYYDGERSGQEYAYFDIEDEKVTGNGLNTDQMTDDGVLTAGGAMGALGEAWEKRSNNAGEIYYPELRVFCKPYSPNESVTIKLPSLRIITAATGIGGVIIPSGTVSVVDTGSQTFNITADTDYIIADVIVDGISVGSVSEYTFANVTDDHTIDVLFTYTGMNLPDLPDPDPAPEPEQNPTPAPSPEPVPVTPYIPPIYFYSDNSGSINDSYAPSDNSGDDTYVSAETSMSEGTAGQSSFEKQIESGKSAVVIKMANESNAATVELTMKNIEDMTKKLMTLSVQAENVVYEIPAGAIDTDDLMAKLGTNNPVGVTFNITVTTNVDSGTKNLVNSAVVSGNGELVLPAVSFTVTAVCNGTIYEIKEFEKYIERTVEITAEQAEKITTAVVVSANGTIRQVPTNVYKKDGKWYVTVSSMTNSVYAMISHAKTFEDIKGRWYEASVNEMASRKIINGISDTEFEGERSITRAEFCAIVTRALGLPDTSGESAFSDIIKTYWYCGAVNTAYRYGIVNGRGEGTFDPQANITWQEAMLMIQRAAKVTGYKGSFGSLERFADREKVDKWAVEAARFFAGSGLLASNNDGSLNPLDDITRAETADVILKLLRKSKLIDVR